MSLERRLQCIEHRAEQRRRRQLYQTIAQDCGLTVPELLAEVEAFLAQPLADQLAEVDAIAATMQAKGQPWDDVEEVKAVLRRAEQP
jgi:hypothetical protein